MKHIKLFENFDNAIGNTEDLIFDWMPFDNQMTNSEQSSIPAELSMEELVNFVTGSDAPKSIQELGLFMAHRKNNDGGFTRFITKSISPLIFEAEIFNSDFESVNKIENIDATKFNVGNFTKGSSMLGKFGLFGKKDQE